MQEDQKMQRGRAAMTTPGGYVGFPGMSLRRGGQSPPGPLLSPLQPPGSSPAALCRPSFPLFHPSTGPPLVTHPYQTRGWFQNRSIPSGSQNEGCPGPPKVQRTKVFSFFFHLQKKEDIQETMIVPA